MGVITCKSCQESFPATGDRARNTFCSRSCAATYNNLHRTRRLGRSQVLCPICQKRTTNVSGFCSPFCKDINLANEWLSRSVTYVNVTRWMRRWLTVQQGEECWICHWNTRHPDGSSILQVDHMDGDSTNNCSSNLRLLCPNCHALTPTYGGRNLGNGRARRRSKYGVSQ